MIQLVIFDMAGTAINEDNLVYKTIQSTLIAHQVAVDLQTVLKYGAGKEKKKAIRDILSFVEGHTPDENRVVTMHQDFNDSLNTAYDLYPMSLFPSVRQVMETLREKGIKIAFNTGYSRPVAEKILQKVGVKEYVDIDRLMTSSDVDRGRPAPDMILKICTELNISPDQVVKIGDSAIDIEEGKAAKVKFAIGITTGAQTRAMMEAAEPDYILDDMLELVPFIG